MNEENKEMLERITKFQISAFESIKNHLEIGEEEKAKEVFFEAFFVVGEMERGRL